MSLFPVNKPNSQQPTILYGYPVQTSIFGKPLSLVYGTHRIAGNVMGVFNWQAHPVKSGGKGGKGSGGGKFGSGSSDQQFTYTAAVQIALCQGPIIALKNVWLDKTKYQVAISTEVFVIGSPGVNYQVKQHSNFLSDVGVVKQENYNVTVDDFGSPGLTTYSGVQRVSLQKVGGSPGAGQYSLNTATGTYTFSSADNGKMVFMVYTWVSPTSWGTGNPMLDLNLSLFRGDTGQTPWTYLTTNLPDQALTYKGVAYVANDNMDLGQSGIIPNYSYEVMGLKMYGNGILDAEPSEILIDYLTDPDHGLQGWSLSDLGNMGQFRDWCVANGLFVSPVWDTQASAASQLEQLMTVTNCAPVWSDGTLKIIPYGDKTVVGNGVTYTPDTGPIYDLSYDDFISTGDESPITVERPSIWDSYNSVTVEWSNRGNDYNRVPCEEQSLYHVNQYGLRKQSPLSLPLITTLPVAQFTANVQLQRLLFIRTKYKFKLPITYDLLEPMDLVTLTDPNQGLIKTPVRIISIDEDDNGILSIEAEEFPWGTATATKHPKAVSSSFTAGYYADPGPVNQPMFFEPTDRIMQDDSYHLFIALSGGPDWGGANVYVSADSTTYEQIGVQKGPATVGTLKAAITALPNPDNTNTIQVSMLESFGVLASVSSTAADQGAILVQIGDELLSYTTATLTGPYTYTLSGLRRGLFGTPIESHAIGDQMCLLNTEVFDWMFTLSDVGNLRYFKFASFNKYGQSMQSLADCVEYQYTPLGISKPLYVDNVDTKLEPITQYVIVKATTQNVNITLPDEEIAVGVEITVVADGGNTFDVFVRPDLVSPIPDTIEGSSASVTLNAGEFVEVFGE